VSLWRQLTRGLRVLANRQASDQNIADEVSHFLDEATDAFVAQGLSPDEARRAARMEIGNATVVREQVRGYGWENAVERLFADLRHAARRLCVNPGFTAVSVLTLALGIGATAAIFSVIEGVLLKPLPYPAPEQLVDLRHTSPANKDNMLMATSLYFTYREESRVFQGLSMWQSGRWSVTDLPVPEEVSGLMVTDSFLRVLGVQPAFGRQFSVSDVDPGSERTVILSDSYWRSHFGGERAVLGRRLLLDGDAYAVVGVLPASFQFMDEQIALLVPYHFRREEVRLFSFCCQGIARLKAGITLAQANADVARMLPMAPAKFPPNFGFSSKAFTDSAIAPGLRFLKDELVGDIGRTLWVLMGTVGIVWLIACANVANLLLVRADGRRQELAIRGALGAGWIRIACDLLLESALLGVAGGALGLALAYVALRALVAFGPGHLPRMQEISIDPAVLLFTLGISLTAGLLFGLIPVWKYARPYLSEGLRGGGRSLTESRERHRARGVLIAVQVALALVLLVGAGLMIRSFRALRRVDPGFSGAPQVETLRIFIPESQVRQPERVIRTEEEILRRIEALSGVSAVAMASALPMENNTHNPVYVEGDNVHEGAVPPVRRFQFVSPGYISAIGSHLIVGRDLTWTETYRQAPVALISENMAREVWDNPRAALGKRIRSVRADDWREVIGVVADVRDDGIDQPAPTITYWPLLRRNFGNAETAVTRSVAFVIRTPRAGSVRLRQQLQQAIASANANLPVADVKTLETVYNRSLARTSFTLALLAIAGGMSLLLGVVGLYGVISYSVSQRTREIGIRIALGAPLGDVARMYIRHGLVLSGIGEVCGLAMALSLTRLMKSLLYGVSPADPMTYGAVSAGLILAAALASYLPARRATRVDPLEALRVE
jgi:putative ABC transport system permease protein